ncbi:SDR family NAD(P)-dependent oxidoreductase [Pseudonocardia hispaniensis]|uniref:SDR family NAD(P)-dependent oxidoreductase n=1 Tax=Pseudonocardia hispaniensis TaxID=904933 RepID=A0ABW1J1S8_9PSEU
MKEQLDALRFDGRVALVTGAGGGLGRSYAHLLAARGTIVIVNDVATSIEDGIETSRAEVVAQEIRDAGGVAVANRDSVGTAEGGEAMVSAALETFGRLDIVVNNAGIVRDRAFHNLEPAESAALFDVHLMGCFHVTRPAWRWMRQHGYGRVVNTTSASGLFGNFGQTAYAAAKAGVVGFTRALALEVGERDIRVNAVAPMALTQLTDGLLGELARHSSPDLVAPTVAFLCHESNPLNGEVISSGGGRISRTFLAETPGLFDLSATPEDIASALSVIVDEKGYTVPKSLADVSANILAAARRGEEHQ